jgi:outer membrane protein OmpA-like peptidoglycan-associated protein
MHTIRSSLAAGTIASVALIAQVQGAVAECSLIDDFNRAVAARNLDQAKAVENQIKRDSGCGSFSTAVVLQRTSLEVLLAQRPENAARREELLLDADQPNVLWVAADALGKLRLSQRRFLDASGYFERTIEMIKNPSKTPNAPPENTIKAILDRAAEARLLAANEEENPGAQYAKAAGDFRDGTVGGSFSDDVRGIKPTSVPVPINFETGTDKPTPLGLKAAAELLAAIQDHPPAEVTIVGHTDERGADQFNIRLSEARARAVARYLQANGIAARIIALGVGYHQPLKIEDAGELTRQDVWALNRRVEWRRSEH